MRAWLYIEMREEDQFNKKDGPIRYRMCVCMFVCKCVRVRVRARARA